MAKPAPRVHNHKRRILGVQPSRPKSLYPGMICNFKYVGENIKDKSPLVLIVWNDSLGGQAIHGINFNYISEYLIKMIVEKLIIGADPDGINKLTEETDEKKQGEVDRKPGGNQLKEPYTRIQLPTYGEPKSGKMMSRTQAMAEMKQLYNKVLKQWIKKEDMYRTYSYRKMKSVRVVKYDLAGLLK